MLKGFFILFMIFAATITGFNAMGTGRIELSFLSFVLWGIVFYTVFKKKKKST